MLYESSAWLISKFRWTYLWDNLNSESPNFLIPSCVSGTKYCTEAVAYHLLQSIMLSATSDIWMQMCRSKSLAKCIFKRWWSAANSTHIYKCEFVFVCVTERERERERERKREKDGTFHVVTFKIHEEVPPSHLNLEGLTVYVCTASISPSRKQSDYDWN